MVRRKSARILASMMSIILVISMLCMGTVASAAEIDTEPSNAGGATAVFNNAAGWGTCYVYYWGNGGSVSNGQWPGEKLTDAHKNAEGFYEVTIPETHLSGENGVIFNGGSGGPQSADLTIKSGECKLYNNKDSSWKDYDTNPLKLTLAANAESPQYKGTEIALTATANGGSGVYTYTFKANSTTIYTGSNNTCTWTPTSAGNYTVSVDVSDTQGNKNSKSLTFEIKDDATAAEPILKGITTGYANNTVPVNASVPVNVNAAGGKIGTNLLFYKVAVLSPSGTALNTVYYKQSNTLNFTPTQKGDYTVKVTVQNSHNATVERSFTVKADTGSTDIAPSISAFTASKTSVTAGTPVTLSTTVAAGTGTPSFSYAYSANGASIKTQVSSSRSDSITWTPTTAGTYTLEVIVADSKRLSDVKTIKVTVTQPSYTPGDVTLDGKVNVQDTLYVMKAVNGAAGFTIAPGSTAFKAADMDGNSTLNVVDVLAVMKLYLN